MRPFLLQLRRLVVLLFFILTLLFFLLRAAGDPASALAGATATAEQLDAIRAQYGLDKPLVVQYLTYVWQVLHLDFGNSFATGEDALWKVLQMLKRTLHLAMMAILLSTVIAVPTAAWLGMRPEAMGRRVVAGGIFVLQGVPGYVTALVLIQVFAVQLGVLPSMGYGPLEWNTWIMPTISLAFFMAPQLIRVMSVNVSEAMGQDFIRTARAYGASPVVLLWTHAVPNALLGTAALVGTQFAMLIGGSAIIETIFSWPGIGWLLLEAVQGLDFPVVQAVAFVIAILVFVINAVVDLSFRYLDPRLRSRDL